MESSLLSNPDFADALSVLQTVFTGEDSDVQHAIRVAGFVLGAGGTADQVRAALLHDVIEDGGARLWPVIEGFGDTVTAIVRDCTDCEPTGSQKSPWLERKVAHVEHLRKGAFPETYLVVAADKLDALNRTLSAVRPDPTGYWSHAHFKGGCLGTLWYYRAMAANLALHLPDNPLTIEVLEKIAQLVHLVDSVDPLNLPAVTDDELLAFAKSEPFPRGIKAGEGGLGSQ